MKLSKNAKRKAARAEIVALLLSPPASDSIRVIDDAHREHWLKQAWELPWLRSRLFRTKYLSADLAHSDRHIFIRVTTTDLR